MQTQVLQEHPGRLGTRDDYEYLLVISPAAGVYDQLVEEKKQFYDTYKHEAAMWTKPHITVARFNAKEAMEDTIIRYMHRILSTHQSFSVMLNNYSGTPNDEIFIRVQQREPFKQLASALGAVDEYIQRSGYPAAKFSAPHLSIAKRLQENIYNKAIFDYSQRIFNASFVVSELLLLKRQNKSERFKMVNVFKLTPEMMNN